MCIKIFKLGHAKGESKEHKNKIVQQLILHSSIHTGSVFDPAPQVILQTSTRWLWRKENVTAENSPTHTKKVIHLSELRCQHLQNLFTVTSYEKKLFLFTPFGFCSVNVENIVFQSGFFLSQLCYIEHN